jgi:anti-sigma-K factor RskA
VSDLHSLAGEYAVGGLTEEETSQFESHLATCADCRKEVAEMRDIAVQLSEAVATEPPASLRASVLEQIAHTAQYRPSASADPAVGRSNVVPLQRSVQRRTRITGLLAAAAVLAAIAMGGWAVHSRNDANQAAQEAQRLTDVLSAKDVRTASADFGTRGNGTVVVSQSQRRALLVAADLPALPSGKVYEAWTIRRSPTPAGTFSAGSAQTVVSLPASAVSADSVAVTVEPAGGSSKPTTNPVFAVKVPRA